MNTPMITPEERALRRAARNERKDARARLRAQFLAGMPKGGLAVEIGVWRAEFSRIILDVVQPDRLVLIDPWQDLADTAPEALTSLARSGRMELIYRRVVRRMAGEIDAGRVEIMRELSVPALGRFTDDSVSFAYVDGDHSYAGVSADLAALFPKLRVGGVMAFDDYHRRGWWGDGVIRAIHEFIGRHARDVRVLSVVGAQFALEKVGPPPADAN